MTVFELMERLTGIGAGLSAEGDQVAVRFPEEHRRDVERLGPEIQRLKPELLRELARQGDQRHRGKSSPEDIDLALKITGYLETLPADRSATISELAEALHRGQYKLDHLTEIHLVCEELRGARIVIRGRDGYGYQLSCLRSRTIAQRRCGSSQAPRA